MIDLAPFHQKISFFKHYKSYINSELLHMSNTYFLSIFSSNNPDRFYPLQTNHNQAQISKYLSLVSKQQNNLKKSLVFSETATPQITKLQLQFKIRQFVEQLSPNDWLVILYCGIVCKAEDIFDQPDIAIRYKKDKINQIDFHCFELPTNSQEWMNQYDLASILRQKFRKCYFHTFLLIDAVHKKGYVNLKNFHWAQLSIIGYICERYEKITESHYFGGHLVNSIIKYLLNIQHHVFSNEQTAVSNSIKFVFNQIKREWQEENILKENPNQQSDQDYYDEENQLIEYLSFKTDLGQESDQQENQIFLKLVHSKRGKVLKCREFPLPII